MAGYPRSCSQYSGRGILNAFDGKVVLITGGSSGIGLATALAFAKEGAKIVIAARNEDRGNEALAEIRSTGAQARFIPTDVSRTVEVAALIRKTVEAFGRIDCAFNNAAIYDEGAFRLTGEFSEEDFDYTMAVNLKGVWLAMKCEIEQMLRQQPKGGFIVNTASIQGFSGAAMCSVYSATKAGVLALTKSAAQEYAPSGIRINLLVPGIFDTPMHQRAMDRRARFDPHTKESLRAATRKQVALGRIGDPVEAARAVLWLCSQDSSYVVGHSLILDGGRGGVMPQ